MIRPFFYFLVAAFFTMSACKQSQPTAEGSAASMLDTGEKKTQVRQVTIKETYVPRETDDYLLRQAFMEGDILNLEIQYSGGCKDHKFKLISQNRYNKSSPPKLLLYLEHHKGNDGCRSLIKEVLKFDIKDVQYSASQKLFIKVAGTDVKPFEYVYGE